MNEKLTGLRNHEKKQAFHLNIEIEFDYCPLKSAPVSEGKHNYAPTKKNNRFL